MTKTQQVLQQNGFVCKPHGKNNLLSVVVRSPGEMNLLGQITDLSETDGFNAGPGTDGGTLYVWPFVRYEV